jgi:hypothetical protein
MVLNRAHRNVQRLDNKRELFLFVVLDVEGGPCFMHRLIDDTAVRGSVARIPW